MKTYQDLVRCIAYKNGNLYTAVCLDLFMTAHGNTINEAIGFAGQRVIKQTIGADLLEGFQRSEFLLEHGLIDAIVERKEHKQFLSDMIRLLSNNPAYAAKQPSTQNLDDEE